MHTQLSQLFIHKKQFEQAQQLQINREKKLKDLMVLVANEITYEIKHKIPNWTIRMLELPFGTTDKLSLYMAPLGVDDNDIIEYKISATPHYLHDDMTHLSISIRPKIPVSVYETYNRVTNIVITNGQILNTTLREQHNISISQFLTRLKGIHNLLQSLDNGAWTNLVGCVQQKLDEYTRCPIFETKQCIRLILAHWTDPDCTLTKFPRDIIRLICTMALQEKMNTSIKS